MESLTMMEHDMDIRNAFVISDVPDHENLKQKILTEIKKIGIHSSIVENNNSLYNTDWELSPSYPRPYFPIVQPLFEEQNKKICNLYGDKTRAISLTYWFQQYAFGDFHEWHLHGKCLFSSVYYVELAEESSKTRFNFLGKEFEMDVKEGQILSAPSFLLHCSKPNKSKQIKTIIAFNTDLQNID